MTVQIDGNTGVSACQPNSVSQDDLQANVAGKGPAFRVSMSAVQSINSGNPTKLNFNTKQFDTNNYFDAVTNFRFTPLTAGYYCFSFGLSGPASATGGCSAQLRKNGAALATANTNNSATGVIPVVTDTVFLNGTTDFIEAFGVQTTGGAANVGGSDPAATFFSGYLVRAA